MLMIYVMEMRRRRKKEEEGKKRECSDWRIIIFEYLAIR